MLHAPKLSTALSTRDKETGNEEASSLRFSFAFFGVPIDI
jgi:hypothetical protein